MGRPYVPFDREASERRFWAKVDKNGPVHPTLGTACWIWTGGVSGNGYGRFWWDHRVEVASRVAFEIANGPLALDVNVLHHCDNPPCVRPDHLFDGTQIDNVADQIQKGRHVHTAMTQCRRGHPFDEANTLIDGEGHRICRACAQIRRDRHEHKVYSEEQGNDQVLYELEAGK